MIQAFSRLHLWSIGIVAANKKPSSRHIEVIPIEHSPMYDGELTDNMEKYKGEGKDTEDRDFEVEVETTASIRALWLPFGDTNRKTAPDVRRGERVAIWRFGDADEYFWMTLTQHETIRRLETVIYSYSNNREENVENDADSTYYFEVSTQGKYIHLHTAKNDKEPFMYDIQINTKDGCITITDDDDNYIFLDSAERHIKLHNRDNSFVEMNKKIINIQSVDEINLKTSKYTLTADTSITKVTDATETNQSYKHTSANVDYSFTTFGLKSGTYSVNAGTYSQSSSSYTVSSGSYQINTSDANFSGNTHAAGVSYASDHD